MDLVRFPDQARTEETKRGMISNWNEPRDSRVISDALIKMYILATTASRWRCFHQVIFRGCAGAQRVSCVVNRDVSGTARLVGIHWYLNQTNSGIPLQQPIHGQWYSLSPQLQPIHVPYRSRHHKGKCDKVSTVCDGGRGELGRVWDENYLNPASLLSLWASLVWASEPIREPPLRECGKNPSEWFGRGLIMSCNINSK